MSVPRRIGVVGAGTMGRGIVQLFAVAGHDVLCYDAVANAAQAGVEQVLALLRRGVEKGKMSAADLAAAAGRIRIAGALAEFAACDVVIEAVVEDLAVKQAIFNTLETLVPDDAI